MSEANRRKVRLPPEIWTLIDAAAATRHVAMSEIVEEAVRSYFGPRQDLADAARIVSEFAMDRAAYMEKIDLLFLATADDIEEDIWK